MILIKLSKPSRKRSIALFLSVILLGETFFPTAGWALTGGPSQPEVQSFQPISTSDMVDLFSGDFKYNIPLMDVEGYPINLFYSSGISNDQEASWCGLGWNVNPGAINRNMRGLPDDFSGQEKITKEYSVKDNETYGLNFKGGLELFGKKIKKETTGSDGTVISSVTSTQALNGSLGLGVKYNNYTGIGFEMTSNLSFSAGNSAKGSMNAGLGIKTSDDGLTISPSLSFSSKGKEKESRTNRMGLSFGSAFNSRDGLKSLSFGLSRSSSESFSGKKGREGQNSTSNGVGYAYAPGLMTFTPYTDHPMTNFAANLSVKLGGTLFGSDGTMDISAYYSKQSLAEKSRDYPAYGYYYAQDGAYKSNALMDFNREKDGSFNFNTPNLPLTSFTYDVYSVNGQGIGGSYRLFRSDVGNVYDPGVYSPSLSVQLGAEVAGGNVFKGGFDITATDITSTSGAWRDDNGLFNKFSFKSKQRMKNENAGYTTVYEPAYFKEAGEMSVDSDPAMFNAFGAFEPIRPKLKKDGMRTSIENGSFRKKTSETMETDLTIPVTNYRAARQKRNQDITVLTLKEAQSYGLDPRIYNRNHPDGMNICTAAKDKQFAEISAIRPDGMKYVYGLPTYNTVQEERSFSIDAPSDATCAKKSGLVSYAVNSDDTYNNSKGTDHYYSCDKTPAYAYSYLLTAVLSPDYVDNDGITGPSERDNGTYTKLSYTRVYGQNNCYKWRTPFVGANYQAGFETNAQDDKASYIYGEKEIWYLNKIETKNYIVEFILGDRFDSKEVSGRDGGQGTKTMKYLKEINLYTKEEYKKGANKLPVKSAHFQYDYSLCPKSTDASCAGFTDVNNFTTASSLPSNPSILGTTGRGKLTLRKIYFTYGRSFKAKQNAYSFTYGQVGATGPSPVNFNPSYNIKAYDRWGNYKPNPANLTTNPSNSEYPYAEQDRSAADQYATAWNLTQIDLPSGGKIKVDYEADDYAYVQDKQAMQMCKLLGFSDGTSGTFGSDLMSSHGTGDLNYLYAKFQLAGPLTATTQSAADAELARRYLNFNTNEMYFKCFTSIHNGGSEYVTGYAEIDPSVCTAKESNPGSGIFDQGVIKFKSVNIGDREFTDDVHPISKAAWQLGRTFFNREVHSTYISSEPPENASVEDVANQLIQNNIISGLINNFKGENRTLRNDNLGKSITTARSWIRLSSPDKKKVGGGNRVKKLVLTDEWVAMRSGDTDVQPSEYGQVYTYTKKDELTGEDISSGVAAWEPQIGQEENPFKTPITLGDPKKQKLLAPDDKYYQEGPYGESFFPGASVGYSEVTVKNLQWTNVTKHATGYIVHEFYTARDFPVRTSRTYLMPKKMGQPAGNASLIQNKTNPALSIFKLNVRHYLTASQGFLVELNDMHGKPKSQKVYAEGQAAPISQVKYFYKTDPSAPKKLSNYVTTITNTAGISQNALIGVESDIVMDFRENETETVNSGGQFNTAGFLAGLIPGLVPTVWPVFNREHTRFRSGVITRVIQRFGILEKTEVYDGGSKVSTDNLAYDSETGEVLITRTQNDFEDPIYSLKFPAHWTYDRMGMAYRNAGAEFDISAGSSGVHTVTTGIASFVLGDEVAIKVGSTDAKAWVSAINTGSSTITLINSAGATVNASAGSLKILRSGRRNQQMTAVANIVSLVNPLDYNKDGSVDASISGYQEVITASAAEFSENWKLFCECGYEPGQTINPYYRGTKGNWRPLKSLVFLTSREQSSAGSNTDIRKDGAFTTFVPFWGYSAGNWVKSTNNKWQYTAQVTNYSTSGTELENQDALGRYSAALYGYNYTMPTAVSSNAKYKQIAFDGFEDYSYGTCPDDHFGFKAGNINNVKENTTSDYQKYSHTGKRSIKVDPGQKKTIVKVLQGCE
jgi:hypothetical protein